MPKKKIKPVAPAPSTIGAYYSGLRKIINKYTDKLLQQIDPILAAYEDRQPAPVVLDADPTSGLGLELAFQSLVREAAELESFYRPLAKRAMTSVNTGHRRKFITSFRQGVGVNVGKIIDPASKARGWLIDKGVDHTFESAIQANVRLIKTIPEQYLDRVQASIYQGIRSGSDAGSIKKDILKLKQSTYKRARLIARDQIQKFNSVLSMTRQQALGVDKYIWRTSQDERVRESHMEKDGQEFSWASPPGDTGHPGEDINCRCTAEPVLSDLLS